MSTDSIHHAFRGLDLSDPQHDPRKQHQHRSQQQSIHTNTGALRSPTIVTTDLPGQPGYNSNNLGASHPANNAQSPASLGQSAAARFERFFPPSPNTTSSNPSSAGQTFTSSIGSAAGLATNGAFGSFGHSLAPGSMGSSSIGSGHFGSNSNGPRKASSRAAIPSQWSAPDPASLNPPSGASPPKNTASPSYPHQADSANGGDDDVIPTAIVVKNIPFSVKREQLLQIIEDLGIPMPYAFNYHMDQGVFRGLAFANFHSAEEADAVVAALNGFDVSGRKLRVEYKKVLQAGEKERIEKEKAIKRMQSMQLEKERERERRRQNDEYAANAYLMPGYSGSATHLAPSDAYLAADSNTGSQQYDGGVLAPLTADSLRKVPSSQRLAAAVERPTGPSSSTSNPGVSGGAGAAPTRKEELDLNDAATLEIYSRVLLFKDDRMRDELSFSRSLTPLERRTVHLVAQRLGLFHYSMGEGDERYVIVTKNDVSSQPRPLRTQASTIGRTQRSTGIDAAGTGGFLGPGSAATTGRTGLRLKKSAPDMKRDRDGSTGYSGGNGYLHSNGSLAARKSNSNLRDGYSSTSGRRALNSSSGVGAAGLQNLFSSPFDAPPVPALPEGSNNSSPTHSSLLRQPRGPPAPGLDVRNFAVRSRVPTSSSASGSGAGSTTPPPHGAFQLHVDGSPTKTGGGYQDLQATTHDPLEF
ncbi:related to PIN4-protein involved in G2/M phase progression and response to DNA damage [Sporisorium scitamineum]|uniref:Related to PIN4-protein involved in G2/M phase progression and response to DNA damage n=1 Tax=Sporisorium scitamineum TaxID=49012 RepID=A0A0F7S1A6_9BASI|nr:hypothetical protein [Sporisorium scitamineum]CDU25311.1 related to PIN4-protein involved in G2/M phase progression and response to DNA damage [Sporisorium scitamineum]